MKIVELINLLKEIKYKKRDGDSYMSELLRARGKFGNRKSNKPININKVRDYVDYYEW